jgi:hypothetical protein
MQIVRPKALQADDLVAVAAMSGGPEQGEALLFARGVEAIEQVIWRATGVAGCAGSTKVDPGPTGRGSRRPPP